MAATKKSNNGVYLPADLVIEILLKLPVKSIVRFNCVAKNWYHLLKDPTFVSQHYRLSKKNSAASLIICYSAKISDKRKICYSEKNSDKRKIGLMMFGDGKTSVSHHDLPTDNRNHIDSSIELTVGDGLVCLYDASMGSCNMALWNPATKEFRNLPYFYQSGRLVSAIRGRKRNQYTTRLSGYNVEHYVGCGIDPLSNDYKVLCIRAEFIINKFMIYHYAIYRMSSDSWRVWEKGPSGKRLRKLLKFHLDTEVFQMMDSPIPGTYGNLMTLPDGLIAFWDSTNKMADITSDKCGIWVLNDVGNNWTKLINIDLPLGIRRMYGFWMHAIIFEETAKTAYEYDVETRKFINDVGIDPAVFHCVYTHEESLLSVGISCKYIHS
ncbi:hypothetical protein COLO4_23746 [Corchorus olitorius]|uniref:F-box domain-containing protein n=1 Tax=Corchorus olitorius TaxID=93759 RepID=A0A1R3IEY9_9ROSI|nr:hypothetical protein COLO4_23746 [Corchorus olitorius]